MYLLKSFSLFADQPFNSAHQGIYKYDLAHLDSGTCFRWLPVSTHLRDVIFLVTLKHQTIVAVRHRIPRDPLVVVQSALRCHHGDSNAFAEVDLPPLIFIVPPGTPRHPTVFHPHVVETAKERRVVFVKLGRRCDCRVRYRTRLYSDGKAAFSRRKRLSNLSAKRDCKNGTEEGVARFLLQVIIICRS